MADRKLAALFDRYRTKGDLDALAVVFDRTAVELLAVARHLAHDEADAEDLVQATFLAAIEHPERFDSSRDLVPWLLGILTNKARAARQTVSRTPDPGRVSGERLEDPESDAELREFMTSLEKALERVPASYRQVLRIHLAEGKSPEEIARELERNAATVRTQLHRGLKDLRRRLPAGFALGGIVVVSAPRGLAAIRAEVLGGASALAKAGAAVAPVAGITGGVLVGKKLAIGVGIALLGTGSWWLLHRQSDPQTRSHAMAAIVPGIDAAAETRTSTMADPALIVSEGESSELARAPVQRSEETYGSIDMEWTWDDGTPAASVGVGVAPMGEYPASDHSVFGFTDESGRVSFERIHAGKVVIGTERGCSSSQFESTVVAGERTSARFTVPPAIDVRGRVLDADDRPVSGALIWITLSGNPDPGVAVTRSAADGSFLVRAVQPTCGLFATAEGKGSSGLESLTARGTEPSDVGILELRLRGESTNIEGRIVDPGGQAIENAWVSVRCDQTITAKDILQWPSVWTATNAQGAYRFSGLHTGGAEVEVFARGYAVWVGKTALEEGRTNRVDVRVERGFAVEGTVKASDGTPAVGAIVNHGPSPGARTYVRRPQLFAKTDEDGRYRLDSIPSGNVHVAALLRVPRGTFRASTAMIGRTEEVLRWDPTLDEAGKIVGRVQDGRQRPLAGWSVKAGTWAALDFRPRDATTDADGRFVIHDCQEACFVVAVYAPEVPDQPSAQADGVTPGGEEIVLTVASPPNSFVLGRVVDDLGEPLGRASLYAHNFETKHGTRAATQAGDGSFLLGPLPAGTYRISVGPRDRPSLTLDPIEIGAEERRDLGTIRLERTGRLELVLRRQDGGLMEHADVVLVGTGGIHLLETEDGFTFRSEELYPRAYVIHPGGPKLATQQHTVQIRSGETTRMELPMEAGEWVWIRFRPPGDEVPPRNLSVVVRDAAGKVVIEREAGMDFSTDGTAIPSFAAGFARGRYTYVGTSKDGWEATGSFEVRAVGVLHPEIEAQLVRRR